MQLIAVNNQPTAKEFLELYKNDPNWIRPLNKDINDVFDKKKINPFGLEMWKGGS